VVRFGRGFAGLGHTRLSILDLSARGHQPIVHAPTGCRLIFNGEIYNFRRLRRSLESAGDTFQGGSDSEVLLAGLARYGTRFLPQLEGMYAFAFLDPRHSSLLLARDPAGIKPLYIAHRDGYLVFASEVRSLLATGLVPPSVDRRGVAGFLAYGAVQHPFSMIEGISSLAAGTSVSYSADCVESTTKSGASEAFWKFPALKSDITMADAVGSVRTTLDDAVRDHLIADVPVGLFLSSGIDSTILAGLAARHSPAMRSFTVVFEGDPVLSEHEMAAETAKLHGLEHVSIQLPQSMIEETVLNWLGAADEPSIDGLNVFAISQVVRECGLKVALSGLGADELFGGYPSFSDVPRLARIIRNIRKLPPILRRRFEALARITRPSSVRGKVDDMFHCDGSLGELFLQRRRLMSDSQLEQLGLSSKNLGLESTFLSTESLCDVESSSADEVRLISQLESRNYQGNMLLRDSDVNGMAFGLEIRVPYLDQRLLDLVHSLPASIRLPGNRANKHLLRMAFKDLLRPGVTRRRKRGFTLPIWNWMAGILRPMCEAALSTLKDSELVQAAGVESVWSKFLARPNSQTWSRALSLVSLGDFISRLPAGEGRAATPITMTMARSRESA
jgi:asparagine synthase (glutamine-hydrolysing)